MKILVTAFEPFGGDAVNPSLRALEALSDTVVGAVICRAVIPVVFGQCVDVLRAALDKYGPDGVICLGMAAGRGRITPEVFAVNARYAGAADNGGQRFESLTPCDPTGPDAYRTKLPVEAMVKRMQEDGIPASLSFTAGTYVCNDLFYGCMSMTDVPAGFIHVPQAAEDAPEGRAAMPQEQINRGVVLAVKVLAEALGQ
ncbi:MAG: pyroglutamyl-peptidase I [Clostridia bacterium]|nr:pyroglutamyl-peptidase I [Clostridia bacterium]